MTRTHGSDKLGAYVESTSEAWQQGLSYNFVNLHLGLNPNTDIAVVPFNTPIFTLFPVVNRQNDTIEDRNKLGK